MIMTHGSTANEVLFLVFLPRALCVYTHSACGRNALEKGMCMCVCMCVWGGVLGGLHPPQRPMALLPTRYICAADHRCAHTHIYVNICVYIHLNGVLDDVIQSPKDPLIKVNRWGGCCASLFLLTWWRFGGRNSTALLLMRYVRSSLYVHRYLQKEFYHGSSRAMGLHHADLHCVIKKEMHSIPLKGLP